MLGQGSTTFLAPGFGLWKTISPQTGMGTGGVRGGAMGKAETVLGEFKHVTFIMHLISSISTLLQIIRNQIPTAGDPSFRVQVFDIKSPVLTLPKKRL